MKKLTAKQQSEIDALVNLPDDQIDTSELPEFVFTARAVVGKFFRPIKRPISIRVDADVLEWLKQSGPGYQRRINDILRREMNRGNQS